MIEYKPEYQGNQRVFRYKGEVRTINAWAKHLGRGFTSTKTLILEGLPLERPSKVKKPRVLKNDRPSDLDAGMVRFTKEGEKVCPHLAKFARMPRATL